MGLLMMLQALVLVDDYIVHVKVVADVAGMVVR